MSPTILRKLRAAERFLRTDGLGVFDADTPYTFLIFCPSYPEGGR